MDQSENFRQVWTSSDKSRPICTSLDQFKQVYINWAEKEIMVTQMVPRIENTISKRLLQN